MRSVDDDDMAHDGDTSGIFIVVHAITATSLGMTTEECTCRAVVWPQGSATLLLLENGLPAGALEEKKLEEKQAKEEKEEKNGDDTGGETGDGDDGDLPDWYAQQLAFQKHQNSQ